MCLLRGSLTSALHIPSLVFPSNYVPFGGFTDQSAAYPFSPTSCLLRGSLTSALHMPSLVFPSNYVPFRDSLTSVLQAVTAFKPLIAHREHANDVVYDESIRLTDWTPPKWSPSPLNL